MSTRKYKRYITNPDVQLPKTTAWRYKQSCRKRTSDPPGGLQSCSKRKTDSSIPIPRATLWLRSDIPRGYHSMGVVY